MLLAIREAVFGVLVSGVLVYSAQFDDSTNFGSKGYNWVGGSISYSLLNLGTEDYGASGSHTEYANAFSAAPLWRIFIANGFGVGLICSHTGIFSDDIKMYVGALGVECVYAFRGSNPKQFAIPYIVPGGQWTLINDDDKYFSLPVKIGFLFNFGIQFEPCATFHFYEGKAYPQIGFSIGYAGIGKKATISTLTSVPMLR
jgi:hypothetical protein